jgi:hypothetical protein
MSKNLKLMWGSDPEASALYVKDGQQFVLPPYFLREYRDVPYDIEPEDIEGKHPVFIRENGLKIIEDGAAFEFTVPPSTDFREVWERVQECAELTSQRILSRFPEDCAPTLSFLPAVAFDVERWAEEGEAFHWATRFGCDPQRDAFDIEREDRVIDASQHPWRYMGGHIHMSGVPEILEDIVLSVKSMALLWLLPLDVLLWLCPTFQVWNVSERSSTEFLVAFVSRIMGKIISTEKITATAWNTARFPAAGLVTGNLLRELSAGQKLA